MHMKLLLTSLYALAHAQRSLATDILKWQIPSMSLHYMGSNSGIGSGSWPDSAKFNSTMKFILTGPTTCANISTSTNGGCNTTCAASWMPPAYPVEWTSCMEASVQWRFQESQYFSEGNFTLEVLHTDLNNGTFSVTTSTTSITSNIPSNSSSYLTCLAGAPMTGIHCALNGPLSRPGPIPLPAAPSAAPAILFGPFRIPELGTYSPSGRPGQPCAPSLRFTINDTNTVAGAVVEAGTVCNVTWACGGTPPQTVGDVLCEDPAFAFNVSMPEGGNVWRDFVVSVEHTLYVGGGEDEGGGQVAVKKVGNAPVRLGAELAQQCGGSGACFWSLRKGVVVDLGGVEAVVVR